MLVALGNCNSQSILGGYFGCKLFVKIIEKIECILLIMSHNDTTLSIFIKVLIVTSLIKLIP